ncbi:hypothetical protein [Paracoccus benzoatiresistens]|uniref:Uncharacterized protein n=1 Tax=Paracoccus benzoatiresistens TaxID=2997341 RepID=A0ABT4J854_9RHOB|nr:hypothetical protein [Paracoccus sp. EF6]MCZ0963271.1 hypothetical protein [Paracoccus sp. EF6]
MRGSQPKWNHVVARTMKRPRDVIKFLNASLQVAKRRRKQELVDAKARNTLQNIEDLPLVFTNKDIVNAREIYSPYLKAELDDEIKPHWEDWEDALRTLSIMEKEVFQRDEFTKEYGAQKSSMNLVFTI